MSTQELMSSERVGRCAGAGGLLRAVLTLVAGGALAQALPLLLGPWLTRLYSPQQFGVYHLFAALAANVAVVACARYEFALPLVVDIGDARALRALCLRVLAGVSLASAIGAGVWCALGGAAWTAWLPVAVAVLGWLSLATLWATRARAYHALALSRVVQYGGAALAQAGAAVVGAGVLGLIVAPIVAAAAAAFVLRLPQRGDAAATPAGPVAPGRWRQLARELRDFPLLNTPHAFMGALQDTVSLALVAAWQGPVAAGFWGLSLRYLKAPATLVGGAVSQALYPQLAARGACGRAPRDGRPGGDRAAAGGALVVIGAVGFRAALRCAVARRRRTRAHPGALHRSALRRGATGRRHARVGRSGLGAAARVGGPSGVPVRASCWPQSGGPARRGLECVDCHDALLRLLLPAIGVLARPRVSKRRIVHCFATKDREKLISTAGKPSTPLTVGVLEHYLLMNNQIIRVVATDRVATP
jgi:hypothetical protein